MHSERQTAPNVDPADVARFGAQAAQWWDPDGPSRPLHEINGCRVDFVAARISLAGADILDVGCGGGILAEALARRGARVTGIDAAPELVEIASQHAAAQALQIRYEHSTAEAFAASETHRYDAVTCMELLEHVPDPAQLLASLARLLKPGGSLFLSTLNRTPRAYLEAVLAAEYVLGLLPRGTHDYRQFLRPSEVAACLRAEGLEVLSIKGMRYQPLRRRAVLVASPAVNYLLHARSG